MPETHAPLTKTVFSQTYSRLIARLRDARRDANITQADLAARLAKPQSYVSKYEHGQRRLDILEFIAVCRTLGLRPSSIIAEFEDKR